MTAVKLLAHPLTTRVVPAPSKMMNSELMLPLTIVVAAPDGMFSVGEVTVLATQMPLIHSNKSDGRVLFWQIGAAGGGVLSGGIKGEGMGDETEQIAGYLPTQSEAEVELRPQEVMRVMVSKGRSDGEQKSMFVKLKSSVSSAGGPPEAVGIDPLKEVRLARSVVREEVDAKRAVGSVPESLELLRTSRVFKKELAEEPHVS